MSSKFVRDQVIDYMETEFPEENIIDLTAHFDEIEDLLSHYNLTLNDSWVGIQFIGNEEIPVSIQGQSGCFRELGAIYIHVVAVSSIGVHRELLTRSEAIRNKLRAKRIADEVIIEKVSPPNFGEGVSLNFESGYTSATIIVFYQRDLEL